MRKFGAAAENQKKFSPKANRVRSIQREDGIYILSDAIDQKQVDYHLIIEILLQRIYEGNLKNFNSAMCDPNDFPMRSIHVGTAEVGARIDVLD